MKAGFMPFAPDRRVAARGCRDRGALPIWVDHPVGRGRATDCRDSSFIGSRIITSPAGCRSILAISWSTAAPPSSASGMATLVTGTSRKARHSSSSKLTTDI